MKNTLSLQIQQFKFDSYKKETMRMNNFSDKEKMEIAFYEGKEDKQIGINCCPFEYGYKGQLARSYIKGYNK